MRLDGIRCIVKTREKKVENDGGTYLGFFTYIFVGGLLCCCCSCRPACIADDERIVKAQVRGLSWPRMS